MSTIANRITKARESIGLNKKELSKKIQVSESTMLRFERGIREPRADVILKLSKVLGVSTNYLLFGLKDTNNSENTISTNESIEEILLEFSSKLEKCIETNDLTYKNIKLHPNQVELILTKLNFEFLKIELDHEKEKHKNRA